MSGLGVAIGARHRVVEESRIRKMLLLLGWAYRLGPAERASSERAAAAALDDAVRLGLGFGSSGDGTRRFDPAEVLNFLKRAGRHGALPFWPEHFVATARDAVREFHPGDPGDPPLPTRLGPARFRVNFRRKLNLEHCAAGAPVRLRLPLPLEDGMLADLVVREVACPETTARIMRAPGRLDLHLVVPPERRVTLGVATEFIAWPAPAATAPEPLTPAEAELYTRLQEGPVQAGPRIRALAATLGGGLSDPWQRVERFWSFLLERLSCGVMHYDELQGAEPPARVLDTGWFDCRMGSAVLVSLCRASGIPARLVGGYMLYSMCPGAHYWAEIWIAERGWLPLDPIAWDLAGPERDAGWRDCFFGRLDYRMKTECLPRLFTGTPGLRFPPVWHMVPLPRADGVEIGYHATDSGALIHRDRIAVHRTAVEAAAPIEGFAPASAVGPAGA